MTFKQELATLLADKHLLKHPFYQRWTAGELKLEDLQLYARQYAKHVDAFPRYVSATHSNCEDIRARQILLDNLIEEEKGDRNHPELWRRFAEGVGTTRSEVDEEVALSETKELVDTFMNLSQDYATGLGALFAYEHQVPEVAVAKIEGLEKHYGIKDKNTTDFFKVHYEADEWHSDETAQLINELSPEDRERAKKAATQASKALWSFLDGVDRETTRAA